MKNKLLDVINILENGKNLAEIKRQIIVLESNANKLFSGDDLKAYLSSLSVAKYTSEYWMPKDMGGKGNIENIIDCDFFNINPSSKLPRWAKWAVCDLVGGGLGGPAGAMGGTIIAAAMTS